MLYKKSNYFFSLIFFFSSICFSQLEVRTEDGLAITHPRILRTMQQRASGVGIGLAYYLDKQHGATPVHRANDKMYELSSYKVMYNSLVSEIEKFRRDTEHKKWNTVGVGVQHHSRLFDLNFLKDDRAVFSLIGVVNRMDKAYQSPETCGETRLIYRLAYRVAVGDSDKSVASRLPFTINVVLNTKSPGSAITCQEIARRWSEFNIAGMTVTNAVNKIFADDGVLSPELRDKSLLKKIEINLQLARTAAGVRPDFGGHAVYLLKVFKFSAESGDLVETVLQNQVSREKAEGFYSWLFDESHLRERLSDLDKGTILIPEEFLSTRAYSIAPGGLSRMQNHPLFKKESDDLIKSKLEGLSLENIKSVEGFKRRLTDISCTGCHQTRAIGGFHFMGQDPLKWSETLNGFATVYPGNSVVVPASGHFFADLERRREVLNSFTRGTTVNYSSGFSSKPQGVLNSLSGLHTGWGAHCHLGDDPSFANWTCSSGLKCLGLYESEAAKDMGVCVSESGTELGDPTERGVIKAQGGKWYNDKYTRSEILFNLSTENYVNSPQSPLPGTKTGGFPGGSIRLNSCQASAMSQHESEGLCGALPAAGNGFNNCIFNPSKSFEDCVQEFAKGVGLRSCSRSLPCRDDYICVESMVPNLSDSGVCVPPYFLFQFRVDGHPIKF